MGEVQLNRETAVRLLQYSTAAGLGAFAFGAQTPEALSAVVYTDLGGIVIERGESAEFDVDGDGYLDFRLVNTNAGGISGYGTVRFMTSIDAGWYGPPVTGVNPASYAQINASITRIHDTYYINSFIDGEVIGPGNPSCIDEPPSSGGRFYGLLSQYPGWDKHSFWNPSPNPSSYGYDYNEYAGLRMVDINGDTRYAWIRFQIVIHDTASTSGFPIPDGQITYHDFFWDTDRYVVLYDYAYGTDPNTDICSGCDDGCWGDHPCKAADLNEDCYVGLADLDIVLSNWNRGDPGIGPSLPILDQRADVDGDGYVGLNDLDWILQCWAQGTPPTTLVPEPGALGLLAAGAGALAFSRRHQR